MPPLILDDDGSSAEEDIPYRGKEASPKVEKEVVGEEEDDDDDEEEYVVEKIVNHKFQKGACVYDVKWLNYDDPKDRTWEPEDNLDGARQILEEYWEEIGGRPELPAKGAKKRGRKSTNAPESEEATPASSAKKVKRLKEWSPPPGSWENEVDYVETVEEHPDPKTGKLQRFGYLVWANHQKTMHPLPHIYQKCPQKMLQYYESHLVFSESKDEDATNGDDMKTTP